MARELGHIRTRRVTEPAFGFEHNQNKNEFLNGTISDIQITNEFVLNAL